MQQSSCFQADGSSANQYISRLLYISKIRYRFRKTPSQASVVIQIIPFPTLLTPYFINIYSNSDFLSRPRSSKCSLAAIFPVRTVQNFSSFPCFMALHFLTLV